MRIKALILLAAILAAAAFAFRPHPAPRQSGPIPHDAYVWQRNWSLVVGQAVTQSHERFGRIVYLAAEIAFHDNQPVITRIAPDYAALRACPKVGLAMRIGPWSGSFSRDGEPAGTIVNTAAELLRQASDEKLGIAEFQVDFDCPTAKLDSYATLLTMLRGKLGTTPLTITALPSWLDHASFKNLARQTDGYVLQIHSLRRPRSADDAMSLVQVKDATAAVEKAAGIGIRFRVALPTYGYRVFLAADGQVLAVQAEGPEPSVAAARVMEVRASPAEMASLVRQWTASRPAALAGIIWYRLPVADDILNWRSATLDAVMAGRTPAPRLVCRMHTGGGLVELSLANLGDDDAELRSQIAVQWNDGALLASDALGGFELIRSDQKHVTLRPGKPAAGVRLAPGADRLIGWLRFEKDTEVQTHVENIHP